MTRSYLFVPCDSERKLGKAIDSNADALILDLEDSVHENARPAARNLVKEFLAEEFDGELWVRINPLDSVDALEDLRTVMPAEPHGIVLPKPEGVRDINQLSMLMDVLEQESNIESGQTAVLPIATERPVALFQLADYVSATPRLSALTWGAEDLSAAVGAFENKSADGSWLPPYQLARSLLLFAAAAAGVPAIDTVYTDLGDAAGLTDFAVNARRDGFSGMLAIHPDQLEIINSAFMPSSADIDQAQQIVNLFAENPEVGTLRLNEKMLDHPHLVRAQRILQMVKTQGAEKK